MLLNANSSAALSPDTIIEAEDLAFGNMRNMTGIIDVAKSGIEKSPKKIGAFGERAASILFEDEDSGTFHSTKLPAFISCRGKVRQPKHVGASR
jgi:hypothetical protein